MAGLPEYIRELIPAILMKGELSVARFVALYGDEHPDIIKDKAAAYQLLLMGYVKGAISMLEEMHEALDDVAKDEGHTPATPSPDFEALEKSLREHFKKTPPEGGRSS